MPGNLLLYTMYSRESSHPPVAMFTGEYRPTGNIDQHARILDKSHCGLARRLKWLILRFHWLFGGRQNSPRSLASVNLHQTTGMGQWDWWTLHEQNLWKVIKWWISTPFQVQLGYRNLASQGYNSVHKHWFDVSMCVSTRYPHSMSASVPVLLLNISVSKHVENPWLFAGETFMSIDIKSQLYICLISSLLGEYVPSFAGQFCRVYFCFAASFSRCFGWKSVDRLFNRLAPHLKTHDEFQVFIKIRMSVD